LEIDFQLAAQDYL